MTANGQTGSRGAAGDEERDPELEALRQELAQLHDERLRLRRQLHDIESSRAWRLMLPLQIAGSIATRLRWRLARRLSLPRRAGRAPSSTGARPTTISGREWLAMHSPRRRLARRRASLAPVPAGSAESLTPVLVDYFGRDGSTLMMRLLASSPQIAVGGGYPYEHRYFTYLWRWSHLLDRSLWPPGLWEKRDVLGIWQEASNPLVGPPPWLPRDLAEPAAGEESMSSRCFELVWREFSRRAARNTSGARRGQPQPVRYYAEKHADSWRLRLDRLPALILIVLLRDPRDVFVSLRAFERREPTADFRPPSLSEEEAFLAHQIERQRERLRWIAALLDDAEVPVIRYAELVSDLPAVAARLGERLSVSLDPAAVAADQNLLRRHVTAADPQSSVGRWREELDPAIAGRFSRELGPELAAVGLDR